MSYYQAMITALAIVIIIIIIYKIYIAPYIICKETALRNFTNIIKCKTVLYEL